MSKNYVWVIECRNKEKDFFPSAVHDRHYFTKKEAMDYIKKCANPSLRYRPIKYVPEREVTT